MGNNITCTLYFNYRIAAKLYTLDLFLFFRHIIVNTSIKLITIMIKIIIRCVKPGF